jgi:hypothetical protein
MSGTSVLASRGDAADRVTGGRQLPGLCLADRPACPVASLRIAVVSLASLRGTVRTRKE